MTDLFNNKTINDNPANMSVPLLAEMMTRMLPP